MAKKIYTGTFNSNNKINEQNIKLLQVKLQQIINFRSEIIIMPGANNIKIMAYNSSFKNILKPIQEFFESIGIFNSHKSNEYILLSQEQYHKLSDQLLTDNEDSINTLRHLPTLTLISDSEFNSKKESLKSENGKEGDHSPINYKGNQGESLEAPQFHGEDSDDDEGIFIDITDLDSFKQNSPIRLKSKFQTESLDILKAFLLYSIRHFLPSQVILKLTNVIYDYTNTTHEYIDIDNTPHVKLLNELRFLDNSYYQAALGKNAYINDIESLIALSNSFAELEHLNKIAGDYSIIPYHQSITDLSNINLIYDEADKLINDKTIYKIIYDYLAEISPLKYYSDAAVFYNYIDTLYRNTLGIVFTESSPEKQQEVDS